MKQLCVLSVIALLAVGLSAAVPQMIVYQGRLTTPAGAPVADGTYQIRFRIWNAPAGGTALWDNGPRNVQVADGLFSYALGDSVVLPHYLFEDSGLWLGIRVGSDPEIVPRVKLGSAAYAYRSLWADTAAVAGYLPGDPYVDEAGDTIRGHLYFQDPGRLHVLGKIELDASYTAGNFILWDKDITQSTAKLWGADWGELELHDNTGDCTVDLNATNGGGGRLTLGNASGADKITLDGGATGDAAVDLQAGAINELEQVNEPGVGSAYTATFSPPFGSVLPADSIAITVPTPGYAYVVATGFLSGLDYDYSGLQYASVSLVRNALDATCQATSPGDTNHVPFSIGRLEPVATGTTTFYLTTRSEGFWGGTASQLRLTAMFFPTAYGSVEAVKSSSTASSGIEEYDARVVVEADRAAQLEVQRQEAEAKVREAPRVYEEE